MAGAGRRQRDRSRSGAAGSPSPRPVSLGEAAAWVELTPYPGCVYRIPLPPFCRPV